MSSREIEGMTVDIIRSNRKTISLGITPRGGIYMRVPLHTAEHEIDALFRQHQGFIRKQLAKLHRCDLPPYSPQELSALAEKAAKLIPSRVAYYAEKLGVSYGKITIRCQKTKFGSCSSKGNLNFNCLLADMPLAVLDFVVAHEICHRLEMNHSVRFYTHLEKICPDYREHDQWLKQHGSAYIFRATT